MEDNVRDFNENQLKRTGFAEAFTPELQKTMTEGIPVIKHEFAKEYDGDKVNATLHLKKSATSDHYFLNKFDLSLKKDGHNNELRQTFYLTLRPLADSQGQQQKPKQENRYTLKEGYNLLAGRPVFKNLVSKEGKEYQAWVKLNFNNKMDNGNNEMKQYTNNYGFELENVLSKYSIKELAHDQYKQSLIDSLHRGNLQKATFIDKEGKEEKLYVSPNITLGALNIYDQNKMRLPMDKLVEKQYIGNELAQKLSERLSQPQTTENKIAETEKPKQTQKEAPAQKPSRKQKVK